MDADEARQQLVLARRGVPVRSIDRWAIGLAAIIGGFSMASIVVLRPHPWNMVPFYLALFLSIVVDATRKTRPRHAKGVVVAALGLSLGWGVVESIWFLDESWDTTSFRWVSGVLFGAPVVVAGLFLLRRSPAP